MYCDYRAINLVTYLFPCVSGAKGRPCQNNNLAQVEQAKGVVFFTAVNHILTKHTL